MQQPRNSVIAFPLVNGVDVHRGRADGNNLVQDRDYRINDIGLVCGYGENPHNVVVFGVSTFGWIPTKRHPAHGVPGMAEVDWPHLCTILCHLPASVILVHDYVIQLRYLDAPGAARRRNQRDIPHYSICAVQDGVYTPAEFQEIVYGTTPDGLLESCRWLPCTQRAQGEEEDITIDNGCDESDLEYITSAPHFAVRALCMTCLSIFSQLCLHDKIIVNGLLTIVCNQKPVSLKAAMAHFIHPHMMCLVLSIFRTAKLTSVESNFCGIIVSEIEDHLREILGIDAYDSDEDAIEKVTDLTLATA